MSGKEVKKVSIERCAENCEYLLNVNKWKYATIDMEIVENPENLAGFLEAKGYKTREIDTIKGNVLLVSKPEEKTT